MSRLIKLNFTLLIILLLQISCVKYESVNILKDSPITSLSTENNGNISLSKINDSLSQKSGNLKNVSLRMKYPNNKTIDKSIFNAFILDESGKEIPFLINKETNENGIYNLNSDEEKKLKDLSENKTNSLKIQTIINESESIQEKVNLYIDKSKDSVIIESILPPRPIGINIPQKSYNISRPENIKGIQVIMSDGSISSNVLYTSSDSTVLNVNESGLMSPLKNGASVITVAATANTKVTDKIIVSTEVIKVPILIEITDKDLKLKTGSTYQISAKVRYSDGSFNTSLLYKSSDQTVATVSDVSGLITAIDKGNAVITLEAIDDISKKNRINILVEE